MRQVVTRFLVAAVLLLAPAAADRAWGQAGILRPDDARTYTAALDAAEKGRWSRALSLAARGRDPLTAKIVRWLYLSAEGSGASFDEIAAFMESNPDWPNRTALARRAEAALARTGSPEARVAWFADHPPQSPDGRIAFIEALLARGEKARAAAEIRRAWTQGRFPYRQEKRFYRKFRKYLGLEDHVARLDRLLWDRQFSAARRMMRRVDPPHRALAEARMRLARFAGGVDWAIAQVPAAYRDDPGLMYERLRWRRRKGLDDRAREILADPPDDLVRPALWWRERSILARNALADGNPAVAYAVAAGHRQPRGSPGYAEAEWLAGWIALRFLDRREAALEHFSNMQSAVRRPISLARGAYWMARAAEALGRQGVARTFYARAARYGATYYGQLAATRLEPAFRPRESEPPGVGREEIEAFAARELVQAARILVDLDRRDLAEVFVLRLLADSAGPEEHFLVAMLAQEMERPDLAIRAGKRASWRHNALLMQAYPVPKSISSLLPERALVLSVIRQESEFDPRAVSRAGARGLMQLMPPTARRIARSMRLSYSTRRLIADPDYNVRLGSAYLREMLDRFDGSYPLALAAYNAGPQRVARWLRKFGDPRRSEVDMIDWIERIPFAETRNYVQRVLEALHIYRVRLVGTQVALSIVEDLNGPRADAD